jgi:transcriptional regulator with XRE-family HTH domain
MRTAALLRRRRRLAGLTFRQVAHASYTDTSRVSRYEQGWQYPGPETVGRILEAIDRLEREGAGNPKKAQEARREYEAEGVEAAR